jgi:protein SCO1
MQIISAPIFIGLSGTEAQINEVTQNLGIFYLLNLPDENGSYSVDHTASMMVLDRQGNLKVIWPYGIQPAEMTSDMKILLKDKSGGVP